MQVLPGLCARIALTASSSIFAEYFELPQTLPAALRSAPCF